MKAAFVAVALFALLVPAQAKDSSPLDALVAAYPQQLSGHEGNTLIFRDSTRMDAGASDAGKSFDALLTQASIADDFHQAYPAGAPLTAPAENFDPGRFRNQAFFAHMYGDCKKGAVEQNLVTIQWLGHPVRVTRVNGVAAALAQVSDEIARLPPAIRAAAWPIAGVYSCRTVADNNQPTMHAFAAAIDLNLKYSAYWLWDSGKTGRIVWRNRMPSEIVTIFERHGFIWGGRWYHYDTMHFEYRPELLPSAQVPR